MEKQQIEIPIENPIEDKYLIILFISIKNLIDLLYKDFFLNLGQSAEDLNLKKNIYEKIIKEFNKKIIIGTDINLLINNLFDFIKKNIELNLNDKSKIESLLKKYENIKKDLFNIILNLGYNITNIKLYKNLLDILLNDIIRRGYEFPNYIYDLIKYIKDNNINKVAELLLYMNKHNLDNIKPLLDYMFFFINENITLSGFVQLSFGEEKDNKHVINEQNKYLSKVFYGVNLREILGDNL